MALITKICPVCSTTYQVRESAEKFGQGKTCSRPCFYKKQRAEKDTEILHKYVELENGCKIWKGGTGYGGYGHVTINGKTTEITRVILSKKLGRPLSKGEYALHTCDTPGCMNEDHLYSPLEDGQLGLTEHQKMRVSQKQNMGRDAKERDRFQEGERHYRTKLTNEIVKHIKDMVSKSIPDMYIKKLYPILTTHSLSGIKNGWTWRHIPWPNGYDPHSYILKEENISRTN